MLNYDKHQKVISATKNSIPFHSLIFFMIKKNTYDKKILINHCWVYFDTLRTVRICITNVFHYQALTEQFFPKKFSHSVLCFFENFLGKKKKKYWEGMVTSPSPYFPLVCLPTWDQVKKTWNKWEIPFQVGWGKYFIHIKYAIINIKWMLDR